MTRAVLIMAVVFSLGACALIHPMTRDQRFSKQIVGSWIVAGDSSDYRLIPMHERFYKDGTYRIFWFSDATCTKIIGQTRLTWNIRDGVLTSKITGATSTSFGHAGDVIRSKIISLTKNRMVLQSMDDGTTYSRERSTRCLAPRLIKV